MVNGMSDRGIDLHQLARGTPVAPPVPVVATSQQRTVRRRQPRAEASTRQPAPTPLPSPPLPQPVPPLLDRINDRPDHDQHADTPGIRTSGSAPTWFKRTTPDEYRDPDTAWSLSDLASACPNAALDATSRLDPYWNGSWTGSVSTWLTSGLASRQKEAGLLKLPPRLMVDRDAALDRLTRRRRNLTKEVTYLGSLHSWRTCSTEQLAALTGNTDLLVPVNAVTAAAFCSDLVDIAPSVSATTAVERFGRGMLLRPSLSSVFEQTIKPRLTWAEWLAITGGQDWTSGTQFDRHNLLATELGLRLAEYTDVATVLGERFSTVDLLAGSGVGLRDRSANRRSADLTAVRLDGMRIAIEVTATTSDRFERKVEQWARLLAETPMNQSGLVVVVLIATPPDRAQSKQARRVRSATYQAVLRAVKKHPGVSYDPTSHRIGVATWREWFPAAHKVSDAFLSMRVVRPIGNGDGPGRWEPCDLMDFSRMPFEAKDLAALMAVVDNAGGLGQTPHWLRANTNPPTFITDMLADAGLRDIPRPVSKRPERLTGRLHGHGIGVTIPRWKVPPRLFGLAGRLNEPGSSPHDRSD
jgi:mRNA-degrading endonuclease toxin of MazEF toxin-antitoxin module